MEAKYVICDNPISEKLLFCRQESEGLGRVLSADRVLGL